MSLKRFSFLLRAFVFAAICPVISQAKSPLQGHVIVIDPGHGTINFHGRIINSGQENVWGRREHLLNMEIGKKLGDQLKKEGAIVYYTRTYADYWRHSYSTIEDNESRAFFANELDADVYLSIHCDWDPSRKVNGITTIYAHDEAERLGALVHRSLINNLKARNRKLVKDSYTVLDNTEMPALIIETGFLSNRAEARKIATPAYQTKIASAIVRALKSYFQNPD